MTHDEKMVSEQFLRGQADRAHGRQLYYGCHFGLRSNRPIWVVAYEAGYNAPRTPADAHVISYRLTRGE